MTCQVVALRELLALRKIGHFGIGPNLAMGMRIARSHHCAPVFEDLDMTNPRDRTEFAVLLCPDVNHPTDFFHLHSRNSQIMSRRRAKHATGPALAAGKHRTALLPFLARWL